MSTVLRLYSSKPYIFESLGMFDNEDYPTAFIKSTLFPKGSKHMVESGIFPITGVLDLYYHTRKTHTMGGKIVRLKYTDRGCTVDPCGKYDYLISVCPESCTCWSCKKYEQTR